MRDRPGYRDDIETEVMPYEALAAASRYAFMGPLSPGKRTTLDGEFNLRLVARILRERGSFPKVAS